jgi:signal transduction histidine kinase
MDLLATMQSNGMRLLKLINDLLDLVRLESGAIKVKHEAIDVSAFVRGLVQSVKKVADDKHIALTASVPDEVGWVQGDRDKWEKILLNLVFNAVKFTPGGGKVDVRAPKSTSSCKSRWSTPVWAFRRKTLPNVFSRFWQADSSAQRKFQGAGIGLALVKELVEVQEGTVSVASELNKGTTFTILLPYMKAEPVTAPAPMPASTQDQPGDQWLQTLYRRAEFFPSVTSVHESMRPVESVGRNSGPKVLIADDEPTCCGSCVRSLYPNSK